MTRFVLRRLAIILVVLVFVNFLGYAYANLAGPIRAARIPYRFWTPPSESLLPAYAGYLQGLLQFDLGAVPGSREAVAVVVAKAGLASLGLLGLGLALSVLIGIVLGVYAVCPERRNVRRWLTLLSTVGLAMPSFYAGSLLALASLSANFLRQPGGGPLLPIYGFGWDLHMVLPVLALMVRPTVQVAHVTSGLLVDELGKRYVVTARSVGYLWSAIRRRHALRNIIAPAILAVAGSFRLLAGELILIEWLFGWPGLGRLLAQTLIPGQWSFSAGALLFLNPPLVAALLTAFAAFFLLTDLVAAILVRVSDPRLRAAGEETHSATVTSALSKPAGRNWHLLLGCLVVLLVVGIAVAGPSLAPRDPLEERTIIQVDDGWEMPPFRAFTVPGFPLGSDKFGRDLLSRLLWAVHPTMTLVAIVALVRLALGTLIGIASGWSTGLLGRILNAGITGALSLPVLMVALVAIAAVGIEIGLPAFVIGLSLTGWAETARIVREQTRLVKSHQYVEAARALGRSEFTILLRHALPQVMPVVWMLLALEISGTLMATAGLGFLGYYIGGDIWVEVADFVARRLSGMPELGQMLAASSSALGIYVNPWSILTIGTLIFVAVLGFNLLGEGLRRRLRMEGTHRRTAVSRLTRRFGVWIEERALLPITRWARRRPALAAAAGLLILIAAGSWIAWAVYAAGQPKQPAVALDVPGGHLWVADRHDPWGTLWSEAAGPTSPVAQRILEDTTGFFGGPAVAADGTVYIASNGGTLYALDPDGHTLWQASLAAGAVGAPALGVEGDVYVADQEAGLSAFAPDGTLRWRFQPHGTCVAMAGPMFVPDGAIYYPVGCYAPLGIAIQAISPDGTLIWEASAPPAYMHATPRLDPTGALLFWEDLVIDTGDGSLLDLETPVEADLYLVGADGRTYFLSDHTVIEWHFARPDAEIVNVTSWDYRRLATFVTPKDGGITDEQIIWLQYIYPLQIAWLDIDGRVLGTFRCPFSWGRTVAVGQDATVYVCTMHVRQDIRRSECLALSRKSEDPLWEIDFEGEFTGSALVPGRLYVATAEGSLYAIRDERP